MYYFVSTTEVYHKTEVNASIILKFMGKERGDFVQKYLSCEQVAERYGVKVITVWDWVRKRKLPALKIGKQYRITEDDLKQFEENCKTNSD